MKKLLVILGLLPLIAMAQPPHGDHHGRSKEPALMLGEGRLPPYLDGLDLTEKQAADIKNLLKAKFSDSQSRFADEHAAKADLHALSFSAEYTDDKAKSLLERSIAIHQQRILEKSKIDHTIFMLLTASQQEQLKANMGKYEH